MSPRKLSVLLVAFVCVTSVPTEAGICSAHKSLFVSTPTGASFDSDGSVQDIQAKHDSSSCHDGDTITIPEGTFEWTARVNITKAITLKGKTVITDPGKSTASASDKTIVLDNTPRSGTAQGVMDITATTGGVVTVQGITFKPFAGVTANPPTPKGAIHIHAGLSSAPLVRITGCNFFELYQARLIHLSGWVYGVFDHNIAKGFAGYVFLLPQMDSYGGPSLEFGNGSWSDPTWFGTDKFFFMETNSFYHTVNRNPPNAPARVTNIVDNENGGRVCFRYNYVKQGNLGSHGTEGGPARGVRITEFYKNTFDNDNGINSYGPRGGTFLTHDNTVLGARPNNDAMGGFANFRTTSVRPDPIWGISDGTSIWDENVTDVDSADPLDKTRQSFVAGHTPYLFAKGTVLTSDSRTQITVNNEPSAKMPWNPNQWAGYSIKNLNRTVSYGGYITGNTSNTISFATGSGRTPFTFSPGDPYEIRRVLRVMDMGSSGRTDPIKGSPPVLTATGQPGYPHMVQEPAFAWNNFWNNVVLKISRNTDEPGTDEARGDFVNLLTNPPIQQGTTAPVAVYNKYNAALNGQQYTGDFTYPHPLVSGIQPSPSATPRSPRHLQKSKKAKKKKRRPKTPRITWVECRPHGYLHLLSDQLVSPTREKTRNYFLDRHLFCVSSSGIPIKLLCASIDHANQMLPYLDNSDPPRRAAFQSGRT
jgi:hypothetical protein